MEASPFCFTPERYWTEEKERALIAFFSKHSCLWNHKSENYKNRQLRWKTLEHLRILLSAHPPPVPFTVEDIKNKFKNLRTTFQRQYKMMKASKGGCRSNEVFVPQWKHYQQLMFLQGCWDQGGEEDPLPLSPPPGPEEESQPGLIISFLPTPLTPSPSSSCVPSNIMAKCYWTEERERALIAFYSEHNCLWNKKSENHNNRQLRQRLLEALRSQLFDHSLSLSVEDLKGKFKNLRTVFNREYKAVLAGQAWGKPYTSKWKHYKQMLFLCDQDACDQEEEDLSILMDPREDKELIEHGNQTPSPTLSSFSSNSPQTNSINTVFNTAQSSDAKATYQIYLPSSPETLRLATPDTKPCTNPPPLDVSAFASVQTDCRQQSSDARVHWTEAKVQQIISFYSEHSCLWNHKSESYRNRLLRQSLLETLSSVLSDNEPVPFTVEDIKTKFRNLRTIFQREHKAASSNKTCGSEDFYLPKWKHFRELMFLCDSCDEEDQPPPRDLHFQRAQESSQTLPSSLQYTQTDTKLTVTSPPSPTPPDSRPSSSSSSSSHTDSRLSGCKRTSRRPRPHTNHMLDLMRTFCQSQTLSPHSGFLKYVEECLNETPPDKVKKLKKKIIDTIHSVSEEEL